MERLDFSKYIPKEPRGIPDEDITFEEEPSPIVGWAIGRTAGGRKKEFFDGGCGRWITARFDYQKGVAHTIANGSIYPTKEDAERVMEGLADGTVMYVFALLKQDVEEGAVTPEQRSRF